MAGADISTVISCPAARLCVASDVAGDIITSTSPAGGKSAWHLVQVNGTTAIAAVSCPSRRLCVAGDFMGNIVTSTDPAAAKWKFTALPKYRPDQISALSCPSASRCVALTSRGVLTSADPAGGAAAWHFYALDAGAQLRALDCPGPSLCLASDNHGHLLVSRRPAGGPAAWHLYPLDSKQVITNFSCPSVHFCAAFDTNFNVLTATNPARRSSWHLFRVRNTGFFRAISCASAALCVIVGNYQLSGGVYLLHAPGPRPGRLDRGAGQRRGRLDCLPDRAAVRGRRLRPGVHVGHPDPAREVVDRGGHRRRRRHASGGDLPEHLAMRGQRPARRPVHRDAPARVAPPVRSRTCDAN